jgi:hypothetical protein
VPTAEGQELVNCTVGALKLGTQCGPSRLADYHECLKPTGDEPTRAE